MSKAASNSNNNLKSFSDVYLQAHHRRNVTSTNAYSHLVERPMVDAAPPTNDPVLTRLRVISKANNTDMSRWLLELQENFNIVFYGYGSKSELLDALESGCSEHGDVIRIRKKLHLSALLNLLGDKLAQIGEFVAPEPSSGGLASRMETLLTSLERKSHPTFVILDSLDGAAQDQAESELFSRFFQSPALRLITTVNRRETLLSSRLQLGRGRKCIDNKALSILTSTHGCNWLWHDATTLMPYHAEIKGRNLLVPPHAERARSAKGGSARNGMISQIAAEHILASATERARKLFKLIAEKQLAHLEESRRNGIGEKAATPPKDAVPYTFAFMAAQEVFLASGQSQMKALLSEFADHGLIQSGTSDGGEVLWIAMSPESLQQIVLASSA
jgi:origin recognition complex subunit 2